MRDEGVGNAVLKMVWRSEARDGTWRTWSRSRCVDRARK